MKSKAPNSVIDILLHDEICCFNHCSSGWQSAPHCPQHQKLVKTYPCQCSHRTRIPGGVTWALLVCVGQTVRKLFVKCNLLCDSLINSNTNRPTRYSHLRRTTLQNRDFAILAPSNGMGGGPNTPMLVPISFINTIDMR